MYLCTKHSRDWCQTTGSCLDSFRNRRKWSTNASTTLNGRAYFLSSNTRRKKDVVPAYGSSASFSSAAAE